MLQRRGGPQTIKLNVNSKLESFVTVRCSTGQHLAIALLLKWIQSALSVSLMKFNRAGAARGANDVAKRLIARATPALPPYVILRTHFQIELRYKKKGRH